MNIFDFNSYKDFVLKKVAILPNRGHGQFSKIARTLNIHTSLVSQIFQGEKDLSFEQACDLCAYFGLTELESDYLVALVLRDRAGTPKARQKCERDLEKLKERSQSLRGRISEDTTLSDADNAQFFSHWYYAAIKIMVSLKNKNKPEQIAAELNLPLSRVNKTLEFLVQAGLLFYENNQYTQGPAKMYIPADSPFISRHHINWRIKSIEKIGNLEDDDFCFTMPGNLSIKDAKKLRRYLVDAVDKCVKVVDESEAEEMYCLNVDWIRVSRK